jgi:ESS family glutamate:Na+ symporter
VSSTLPEAAFALLLLAVLLLAGRLARWALAPLRSFHVPSSVVAGALGLAAASPIWGGAALVPADVVALWRPLPGLLIAVVFACLFLGRELPDPRRVWELAGSQAMFGQTIAWGQYVIALSLCLLLLTPVFGVDPMAGALIEMGFQGGHGVSTGLSDSFEELGFPEGVDLANGLATVGLLSGLAIGTFAVNRRTRLGGDEPPAEEVAPESPPEEAGPAEGRDPLTDPLATTLGILAVALLAAVAFQRGLVLLEEHTWGPHTELRLLRHLPLFPVAMLTGLGVQVLVGRTGLDHLVRRDLVERVGGTALDATIAAAIATLSIAAIRAQWVAFLVLGAAGVLWCSLAFLWLAPRMLRTHWFERGLGDYGQSMGMTATGLLLMRIVDPDDRTGAVQAFAYKQLLFEPFVGGGLVTGLSLPIIHQLGALPALVASLVLFAGFLATGLLYFGRRRG